MKILEVNNIDLIGRRFNGYDFIDVFSSDPDLDVYQSTIIKQSNHKKVIPLFSTPSLISHFYTIQNYEDEVLSIHSNLSISTPALMSSKEYQECDVIHFHMFHNTRMSLYSLMEIANQKKVVISLHDPWFFNGHCVHSQECNKWKNGCMRCPDLDRLFPLKEDYSHELWKLKEKVFKNIDVDLVVTSKWMLDMVKKSPITKHISNVHHIPFGLDTDLFSPKYDQNDAKKHFGIEDDEFVIFFRAQSEFKGTEYIVKALSEIDIDLKIALITCSEKGLIDELSDKYHIVELGNSDTDTLIYAYNACDMFLMPSIGESFGMMAIEAMACAKPVVVFNNTALPSVTHAPDCGYLVKNKDYVSLKNAILYLIQNPDERKKRGELGRNIVMKEYDIQQYYNQMKELYYSVCQRRHFSFQYECKSEKHNYKSEECLKNKLNQLSLKFFSPEDSRFSKIFYKCRTCYDHEKIDYSNFHVQFLLNQYNKNLYSLLSSSCEKNDLKIKLKTKLLKHPKIYAFFSKIKRI